MTTLKRILAVPAASFLLWTPVIDGIAVESSVSLVGAVAGILVLHHFVGRPRGYPLMWYIMLMGAFFGGLAAHGIYWALVGAQLEWWMLNTLGGGVGAGLGFGGGAALLLYAIRGPVKYDPADLEPH